MQRHPTHPSLRALLVLGVAATLAPADSQATISLIAQGNLPGTLFDASGLTGTLENGLREDLLGGLGSGLAWAGGNTFLGLPDRGPNAVGWNSAVDDTTSYVPRFQALTLQLTPSGGTLPFLLTPSLHGTTLLYSDTTLNYGSAVPPINVPGKNYFSGRSDNFAPGLSTNPDNARFDPEGLRISSDGKSVFVSDEYGPYVYQFDRKTGERLRTYTLPGEFAISSQDARGAIEISGNTTGRVANKGMEGLAITPDGKTLVGFEQSPLIQDGGDGGRANRIVTIDVATGDIKQYAYDNRADGKNFNSSEILALNDHQFLVLERDGKGLGDNSTTAFKEIFLVDISGAQDVSKIHGEADLLAKAPSKVLFLDLKSALNAAGIASDKIPAKLEGLAFGQDVVVNGTLQHTLFVANDNDFLAADKSGNPNPNQWFVFGVSDADLASLNATFVAQSVGAIPDGSGSGFAMVASACLGLHALRRRLGVTSK